jgi:type II secretory pathway pseudopilin PulG
LFKPYSALKRCPDPADLNDRVPTASKRLRVEGGWTMLELLVATTVMLIVAVAVMALILVGIRQLDNQGERSSSLDDARTALTKMVREIRQSAQVASVGPATVDVLVPVIVGPGDTSATHWVRFDCSTETGEGLHKCTREDVTGGGEVVELVRGIENTDTFTVDESSRTVSIRLAQDVPGGPSPLVLEGGATARNCVDESGALEPCT